MIIWAIVLVVLLGVVAGLLIIVIKTKIAMKNTKVKARLDDVWYHERMGKLREV
jgi:F0F1-type ATP synthase assembly protein I